MFFLVLLLLHLLPLAVVPAFPSQDGASHVETAVNLRRYDDPAYPLLRTFYERNASPEPNLLGHLMLMGLLELARPTVAEKIMVAAYVLALPLAVRYALRGIHPAAEWAAVLGFSFVYSWPLHMGFFNFCWGLALFFVAFGYWVRHRTAMTVRHGAVLALLTLLLASAHVVPLLLALGAIACWLAVERKGIRGTLAALAPVLALLLSFLWRKQPVPSDSPPLGALAAGLLQLESLVSFRETEIIASSAVVLLFAVLTLRALAARVRSPGLMPADGLLLAAAGFAVVYFLAPRRIAGGAYLNERLALFPFLLLILWLGTQETAAPVRRAAQVAAAALATAALSMHLATYLELRVPLQELLTTAPRLEPNRTLLPLSFAAQGWGRARHKPRLKVFLHTASYLAAERGVLNLANYEGNYVHFPLIFRPEVNPFVHLAAQQGIEGDPPCVDVDAYRRQTGRTIDYVMLWGLRIHHRVGEPCTERLLAVLDRDYELTFLSEPRRLVRLYARKRRAS